MSTWKVVVPEATVNYCLNPSAEIAGNFNAIGGTMTSEFTYQFFDTHSYRIQTAADNQGGRIGLQALPNAIHYVTMRVRGTLPTSWDWSLNDAAYTVPVLLEAIDADWSLYGLEFPAAQANGATFVYIRQNGAGAGDFYVDGVQVEQKTGYWTTFCDGTREGCEWNGGEHASSSQRSAQSRAGGRVQDLQNDYFLNISGFISTGMPPITNTVDSYAILPGGELNAIKVQSRVFTLPGTLNGTSTSNLHVRRQALLNVLKPNAVPEDEDGPQPVILRYTGAAVQKQIEVHYEAGLETSIAATLECWERVAIRFLADDPYWYEIGDSANVLDSNDTAVLRYVTARLRATGQWDDLGLAAPAAFAAINDIIEGPDKRVYVVGDFTGWNGTGGAGSIDYIGVYDPQTATWAQVGVVGDFDAEIESLAFAPDGTLYAGGDFTIGGGAVADYLAWWNGAVWAPVAAGGTGNVLIVSVGPDGILYFGGAFVNWNGLGADRICTWNGAAYVAIGAMNGIVQHLAIDKQIGIVYAVGGFSTAGGNPANRIAQWDGTVWSDVGSAGAGSFNNSGYGIDIAEDGTIYFCGSFTNVNGDPTIDYVAQWNGTAWSGMLASPNQRVLQISVAPDGMVYVCGDFSQIGGIPTGVDRVAKWNGASWAYLDISPPGAVLGENIVAFNQDPVVSTNYDVWAGFTASGNGDFSDITTVANDGTEYVFPRFIVARTGGTSAVIRQIRNETTGKELLFDYSLLNGETLTIDLTPTNKSIVSSHFGSRMDAILANSDFGTFALQSGNNLVTCFVDTDATVTAFVQWDDKYWSQD